MRIRWTTCAAVLLGGGFVFGVAATPAASKEPWAMEDGALRLLPAVDSSTSQAAMLAPPMQSLAYPEGIKTPEPTSMDSASITNSAITGPVSVEQLVTLARRDNPEISAARYKASSMLARVPQARAFEDPMLSTATFLEPIQTAAGPQEVMLSLSQKFPWFGKRNARGEIAYYDAQVAFSDLADIELGVIEQLKLAYYDLYFLHESERIYRELRPRIAELITIVRGGTKRTRRKLVWKAFCRLKSDCVSSISRW